MHTRPFHAAATIAAALLAMLTAVSPASAQIARVSVPYDPAVVGFGPSRTASISADGRYVVFSSGGENIVPNDTNRRSDLFVRDMNAGVTTRVSVTSAGAEGTEETSEGGVISDNGRIVVFSSRAVLAPGATRALCVDSGLDCLYEHDRSTGQTLLLPIGMGATAPDGGSWRPSISADGRFVAFSSRASNLAPDDTNQVSDVFVHDRTSRITTRLSVPLPGNWGTYGSQLPALSADGRRIAFTSRGGNFDRTTLPAACVDLEFCDRVFVKSLPDGPLQQIPLPSELGERDILLRALVIDGTGRFITYRGSHPYKGLRRDFVVRHDLLRQRDWILYTNITTGQGGWDLATTRNSRYVYVAPQDGPDGAVGPILTFDTILGTVAPLLNEWPQERAHVPAADATGRFTAFSSPALLTSGEMYTTEDVFRYDNEHDGRMPPAWAAHFFRGPMLPPGPNDDSDEDGRTNIEEYHDGTHPNARYRLYYAEAAANTFFHTRFALLNTNLTREAIVLIRLLGADSEVVTESRIIPAGGRITFDCAPNVVPGSTFGAVIESDQRVLSDRLMTWGDTGYGAHLESAIEAASHTWFFAEGATGSGFSLYYLLSNPGTEDAAVDIDYLQPDGAAVRSERITLKAQSRESLDVASRFPELANAFVSASLTATRPIIAERAMYRSSGQLFDAGHVGAGVTAPAPRWFLAEGATGFFDEFVLIANPGETATMVKLTFLPSTAASFSATREVAAHSRFTVDVKEFPQLAADEVSIIVESVDATPIVVERAMWWPTGGVWYEASLSAGVTQPGIQWGIAEGEQGAAADGWRTYVLVANTDPGRDGQARITLYFDDGSAPVTRLLPVKRSGRATLDVSVIPEATGKKFGLIVTGVNDLPIVVERSLYRSVENVVFASGGTSVATLLSGAR